MCKVCISAQIMQIITLFYSGKICTAGLNFHKHRSRQSWQISSLRWRNLCGTKSTSSKISSISDAKLAYQVKKLLYSYLQANSFENWHQSVYKMIIVQKTFASRTFFDKKNKPVLTTGSDGTLCNAYCPPTAQTYESFSDVGESRVWFASKNLTPCRMHWNDFLIAQIIAKCHSFPNLYDML